MEISKLLKQRDKAWVFYALPNQKDIFFQIGNVAPLNTQLNEHAFILASFDIQQNFQIKTQTQSCLNLVDLQNVVLDLQDLDLPNSEQQDYSKQKYLQLVNNIKWAIKEGYIQKAVASRPILLDNKPINPLKLLENLYVNYPNAFRYLCYIPQQGIWAGASPELLMQLKNNHLHTVALAGTKLQTENRNWTDKEIHEQALVTDYIEEVFKEKGYTVKKKEGPKTVQAAHLEHLKTSFEIQLPPNIKVLELAKSLHPTPAVCGLPKKEALDLIKKIEGYNRLFYTGFLGPCGELGSAHLFVNLRCIQICRDKAVIYVGAGITANSDPEKEWYETEQKAKTVLNIIQ